MQDRLIHVKNTCAYNRTETIQMVKTIKAAKMMSIIFKNFCCFASRIFSS